MAHLEPRSLGEDVEVAATAHLLGCRCGRNTCSYVYCMLWVIGDIAQYPLRFPLPQASLTNKEHKPKVCAAYNNVLAIPLHALCV